MSNLFKFLILIVFINNFNCLESLLILATASSGSSNYSSTTISGGKLPTNLPTTRGKSSTNLPTSKTSRPPANYPTYYVNSLCSTVQNIAEGSAFVMKLSTTDFLYSSLSCAIIFQHAQNKPDYFFFFTFKDLDLRCLSVQVHLNGITYCGQQLSMPEEDYPLYMSNKNLIGIDFLLQSIQSTSPPRSSFTIVATSFRVPTGIPLQYTLYDVTLNRCGLSYTILEGSAFYIKLDVNSYLSKSPCVINFRHYNNNPNYYFFFAFKDIYFECSISTRLTISPNSYCGYKTMSKENDNDMMSHSNLKQMEVLLSTFPSAARLSFTIVVTSYRLPQAYSSCLSSEFKCKNGRCILKTYLCDSHNNCGDRSDEDNCILKCHYNEFKCRNGRCILNKYVCDSHNNCGDRSDEDNCSTIKLSIGAFIGIGIGVFVFLIIGATVSCLARLGRINFRIV